MVFLITGWLSKPGFQRGIPDNRQYPMSSIFQLGTPGDRLGCQHSECQLTVPDYKLNRHHQDSNLVLKMNPKTLDKLSVSRFQLGIFQVTCRIRSFGYILSFTTIALHNKCRYPTWVVYSLRQLQLDQYTASLDHSGTRLSHASANKTHQWRM